MALDPQTAWDAFAPFEAGTIIPAGRLVDRAKVVAGQRVLDIGCGTGVVAVTAARRCAEVTGLDPSVILLERAKENSKTAEVKVDWLVGDAEKMPFEDAHYDIVLSQFGHIFAPHPEVALAEIHRVLKPRGNFVYNAWPPDTYPGTLFKLVGAETPLVWGDSVALAALLNSKFTLPEMIQEVMAVPCLSPNHTTRAMERAIWPVSQHIESLKDDADALAAFRAQALRMIPERVGLNTLAQPYLTVVTQKI